MTALDLDPWAGIDPAALDDPWSAPGPGAGNPLPRTTVPAMHPGALPPTGRKPVTGQVHSGMMGWCYLFHLAEPIGAGRARVAQAQHYLGWAKRGRLLARLDDDLTGRGCALIRYAVEHNIPCEVVRLWKGDRNRERQLKQRSSSRYCPVCNPGPKLTAARRADRHLSQIVNKLNGAR